MSSDNKSCRRLRLANDTSCVVKSARSSLSPAAGALFYFGGDVQTVEAEMLTDFQKYSQWCLESVVSNISHGIPDWHVIAVEPDRLADRTFACYDSFLDCDHTGAPVQSHQARAALHFDKILQHLEDVMPS